MVEGKKKLSDLSIKDAKTFAKYDGYEGFIEHCDKAIAHDPNNIDAYITKAKYYHDKGDFDDEIEVYLEASKSSEISIYTQSVFFNHLGTIYYAKGQYKEALENFENAFGLGNDSIQVKINRALSNLQVGNIVDAIDLYQELMTECNLGSENNDVLDSMSILQDLVNQKTTLNLQQNELTTCAGEAGKAFSDFDLGSQVEC